jgi:hypothetical protein
MMITARQLADLHKAAGGKGQVTVPYSARLTPMAADWARGAKVTIGYGDAAPREKKTEPSTPARRGDFSRRESPEFLWWSDGPCGPAKAAIAMESRQAPMRELKPPANGGLFWSIKTLAAEVKAGKAAGGILLVESAASAVILANRSPSLRAIVGTTLVSVEQGITQYAANVLIIEHPRLSLAQVRNLLSRFVRGGAALSDEAKKRIEELASCG